MTKSILLPIHPEWCEKIFRGKKTIEVRKTKPKLQTPFKCYVYCTKKGKMFFHGGIGEKEYLFRNPRTNELKFDYPFELCCEDNVDENCYLSGKVIGEFIVDVIYGYSVHKLFEGDTLDYLVPYFHYANMKLTPDELLKYGQYKDIYGWHIIDAKLYKNPRKLSSFYKPCDYNVYGNCYLQDVLSCGYQDIDEYSGLRICGNTLTRPPQSFCYVEEIVI